MVRSHYATAFSFRLNRRTRISYSPSAEGSILTRSKLSSSSDLSYTTKETYSRSWSRTATTLLFNDSWMHSPHSITQRGDALRAFSFPSSVRKKTSHPSFILKLPKSCPTCTEGMYTSHADSLKRIHQLVISHGDSNFGAVYLAWTLIVARLETTVLVLDDCPPAYQSFFDSLDVQNGRPFSKTREPIHTLMLQRVLDPSVELLNLLLSLLTTTPLFVTSIAWKTDSSISEPNAVAYRSVVKGTPYCF